MPIDEAYWKKNYADPMSMDGIGNRKDHSSYVKAFFDLEGVEIKSLVDLGFGHGYLLAEMNKSLKPQHTEGIEPSHIIIQAQKRLQGIKIHQMGLLDWCEQKHARIFDLGICTSVLQYLSTHELKKALPLLKKKVRYLYLTVPTDVEYKRQKKEFNFKDDYAQVRTQKEYYKLLSPHFSFIGLRLLESKHFFKKETTHFQDQLFRF
jgi:hypothetical protein